MRPPVVAVFLVLSLVLTPTLSACPKTCVCSTTRDGLHRATCSNLTDLYKFSIRQKHHNINILDLSHNNITKLSNELDRLTEVVTLDLSTNGILKLNKFLQNAKKLVHLNLANNRLETLSLAHLPTSVSSLDLTNNLLKDVPTDTQHLVALEHLELKGNPIDCSCENLMTLNRLHAAKIIIDDVICTSPHTFQGQSWLKLDIKNVCKDSKSSTINFLDMMMGDEPIDENKIKEETEDLESIPSITSKDLEDGQVIHNENQKDDIDNEFLKVGNYRTSSLIDKIEGSGEYESTTVSSFSVIESKVKENLLINDETLPSQPVTVTEDPFEASGEGSGEGSAIGPIPYDFDEDHIETTTPIIEDFNPEPVHRLFENPNSTEFPLHKPPTLYEGDINWNSNTSVVTEKTIIPQITRDTTVSEQIRVTQASEVLESSGEEKPTPHKTGTYVCIAIIVILLVGLIGFAIIKGQIRKRRDRRLLRQQKRDVEKASKEMVDMNKSLLGKPAVDNSVQKPEEKRANGKYELIPTHENYQKKSENGNVEHGVNHNDTNGIRTDSPRDTNQNKNSSRDNNLAGPLQAPRQETSFDSSPEKVSKKDNNSLSSEDIFVPMIDDDTPTANGNVDSEISHPLINGDQNTDSDYLSPSREYVPVYSPDMGRVRIKMTETPKPKTPVLVTRSRSNAGDIIITPADGNMRKSTT